MMCMYLCVCVRSCSRCWWRPKSHQSKILHQRRVLGNKTTCISPSPVCLSDMTCLSNLSSTCLSLRESALPVEMGNITATLTSPAPLIQKTFAGFLTTVVTSSSACTWGSMSSSDWLFGLSPFKYASCCLFLFQEILCSVVLWRGSAGCFPVGIDWVISFVWNFF